MGGNKERGKVAVNCGELQYLAEMGRGEELPRSAVIYQKMDEMEGGRGCRELYISYIYSYIYTCVCVCVCF